MYTWDDPSADGEACVFICMLCILYNILGEWVGEWVSSCYVNKRKASVDCATGIALAPKIDFATFIIISHIQHLNKYN